MSKRFHGQALARRCLRPSWALAALLLSGCASFSSDGGFGVVGPLVRERVGAAPSYQRSDEQSQAARRRVAELLRQPLSADGAVEIALLGNRALQARYARLNIAEADLVRAGRLANPSFRFGRLAGGGSTEIDRAVLFDVLGLLTLPVAHRLEQQRFEQAQLQAALDTVDVAAQARKAYFEAVAAQQLVGYFEQVKEAADAASELARRMLAAGNFNKLARMREQSFQMEATLQLAQARHEALASRERLVRALGYAGEPGELRLPERLPDLPDSPVDARDAEQTAMDKRLDVQMARRETEATASALGLTRATRFVNVLHAGYQNQSEFRPADSEPRRDGFEIELELPLFDFGSTRAARAEAIYRQAMDRTAALAVKARSEVREAYSAYRTAYDVARQYRDDVVPLRQRISEENLYRYNGMLASVFDLLADSREQIAGVAGAVRALRDHWVAHTDLQVAVTTGSPGLAGGAGAAFPAAAAPAAAH